MNKRRITLNLDEDVIDALESVSGRSVSAAANGALRAALARDAHRAALNRWLDELDARYGAASSVEMAAAEALAERLDLGAVKPRAAVSGGVVLDAAAFDVLDSSDGAALRQLMRLVVQRGGEVRCAAVTLAEVSRGATRTRRVEAAVARDRGGQRIIVVPTDLRFAKRVGAILHGAGRGSESIADAHVVAACADMEAAIVITSDPDDMVALAGTLPGTRIVVRAPDLGER